MGQELTARTKYRGLIKKRLVPIKCSSTIPEAGAMIMHGGKTVGDVRSINGDMAIAMLRLEVIQKGETVEIEGADAHPIVPQWMHLPETDDATDDT